MAPATPKLAALTIAAEECVAVEAAPELVELEAFEAELLGEVVVGEDAPVVDPELGVDVGPGTMEVEFKQEEEVPGLTVKGADCATAPVLSRRVRPREEPLGKLQVHVTEVLFCCPRFSRAEPVGLAPGRILKKYGPVPPLQEIRVGSHCTTFPGVLIVN